MATRNRFLAIGATIILLAIVFLAIPEGMVGKMLRSEVNSINPGLIAKYTFDNTLSDSSGNGNNGTNFGATFSTVNKKIGTHALQFNGTSDYVTAGTKASIDTINTGVSVSAWVYLPANATNFGVIAQRTKLNTYLEYFLIGIDASNKINWLINPSGGSNSHTIITTPTGITPNTWHHIVGTYDGATMKLYLDNVLAVSANRTGAFTDDDTPLLFGAGRGDANSVNNYTEFFKGLLDDTSVYNYALSTTEINALYTGETSPENTIPSAPVLVSAVAGNTQVTLTWNAPVSDGGSEITEYIVEHTKSNENTCLEFEGTISVADRTATVTGLENGTAYKFRVYAKNALGESENPSNQISATPTGTTTSYTVDYNSSGGSAVASQTVISPATNVGTLPAEPTKTGYSFSGWYTAADGAGTQFTASTIVNSNITVYAKWTANNNTITFIGNGSTGGSTSTQTLATGATANLTANGFSKTGYAFDGWATSAAGAVVYEDNASYTMGTASVQLYAKWTDTTAPNAPSQPEGVQNLPSVVVSALGVYVNSTVTEISLKVSCGTNETIKLYNDDDQSIVLATKLCSSSTVKETLTVTLPEFASTLYISATLSDDVGNESDPSSPIRVMKEGTTNPAPGAPDMRESSDSGKFNTDNLTNEPRPEFRLDCISGYKVRLYDGDTSIGEVTCTSNTADITPTSPLSPGNHALTAKQSNSTSWDTATASNSLNITIDTTAPAVSAFDIPETLTVLIIPITTFTTSESNADYLITDAATPAPQTNDARWATTPPSVYSSFTTPGMKTLYPWVRDIAGNISTAAHSDFVTITLPDTTAPSVPTNLNTSQVTHSSATITWSPSTDNVGVKEYLITRNGTPVGTVAGSVTTYTESDLSPETNYTYNIKARDNANNTSPLSVDLYVRTAKKATTGGSSGGGGGSITPKVNGQCNPSLTVFSTLTPTKTSLTGQKICKTGTAGTVTYNSSDLEWTYTCRGSGGGTSTSCTVSASLNAAPVSPGTCDLKTVKELPFTSCKLNSSSFLNFHKYLSCLGVVTVKKTCEEAGCNKNAIRQELAAIAVRIREIPLESGYKCQKRHTDTVNGASAWVCEVVEKAQKAGLISATNKQFHPLDTLTRAEAYSILLKSICIHPVTTSQNWQTEVAKTAKKYGFTTRTTSGFEPNKQILRQELYVLAARIAEWKAKNPESCGALPSELVCK